MPHLQYWQIIHKGIVHAGLIFGFSSTETQWQSECRTAWLISVGRSPVSHWAAASWPAVSSPAVTGISASQTSSPARWSGRWRSGLGRPFVCEWASGWRASRAEASLCTERKLSDILVWPNTVAVTATSRQPLSLTSEGSFNYSEWFTGLLEENKLLRVAHVVHITNVEIYWKGPSVCNQIVLSCPLSSPVNGLEQTIATCGLLHAFQEGRDRVKTMAKYPLHVLPALWCDYRRWHQHRRSCPLLSLTAAIEMCCDRNCC